MAEAPKEFPGRVPVPGLADMASPPFAEVGTKGKDPRREAFWYRRTFTIDGALPATAWLKIHKACYGTQVTLNGQPVGEHVGCFTPGFFDLTGKLKGEGQVNELLVRVGAAHTALGEEVPWGHDFEKVRYVPGICDEVEVILCGSPNIGNVQVVPDLAGRKARVVVTMRNPGTTDVEALVRGVVREAKGGKVVGRVESGKQTWAAGKERGVEWVVPLDTCRAWTPDDPFLYEIEVSAVAGDKESDVVRERFGMREFSFDPATKLPMLNGKPCFLRGTNICIYRFYEDPKRGDKPWREEWVRKLIRGFRGMNWNSARFCIGFPPEMWYRIADEEGLMVQDEFPVWGQTGNLDNLTNQYTEWMRERWNHPCVVIWDAQNETPKQDVTGKALTAVRKLDLSNRPWDNGWGSPQAPTDVYESHPYRHIEKGFRMAAFAGMSPRPGDPGSDPGNAVANTGNNPIIINEYGWLWINRDGAPCMLSVKHKSYEHLVPPGAGPDDYREAYARTLAAKTEFWRSGRKVAGVMHFCGLGYSRAGGETSDVLIDLEQPAIEPRFARYVGDAFAPVGIMVDAWAAEYPCGKRQEFPVVVINDLDRAWRGAIRLRLLGNGKAIAEQVEEREVPAFGRERQVFAVDLPAKAGKFQVEAVLSGAGGKPVRSLRDFEVK